MKIDTILIIISFVFLGLCLLSSLVKTSGDKSKKSYEYVSHVFLFISISLVGISQLLDTQEKPSEKLSEPRHEEINYDKTKYLPACYKGGGESEFGEREIAHKFTHPDACVLEFGGGAGSVSAVIQPILKIKSDHVVVQPSEGGMFGGLNQLRINKEACGSQYKIINHVLKKGEAAEIREMVSKDFDLIVADCEGCLNEEYRKNPKLFEHVKMIQVERDDDGKYDELRKNLGMKITYTGMGCGKFTPPDLTRPSFCTTQVWEKE
jgi:hypothetical protein